ncbi:hypothetical protein K9M41_01355 [Candidatus Gracilibacteria bacterium]|nr:hypothetical protein [Candidatus Gracilibacteria bacterium]
MVNKSQQELLKERGADLVAEVIDENGNPLDSRQIGMVVDKYSNQVIKNI